MRVLAAAALALILGLPGGAGARDLADVWQLALQRDPTLAAARHGRDAQQEKLPQARARLLPTVTATAGAQADEARRLRGLSDQRSAQRAWWNLALTQPIIDLRAWEAFEQAEYVVRAADASQAMALQDLILRVTQAYFDILSTQDSLRALEAQILAVQTQLEAARHGFELGSTTITDTHETRARLDLLQANALELSNQLQINRDRLASIIAVPPGELSELPTGAHLPSPEPNRMDDWVRQAEQANLAVVNAQLQMQITEKQRDMAKRERLPQLHLQAQTGSISDRGLRGTGANRGPRSLDSSVGLVLSMPLFTGGELSSVVREESSRLQQRRYELEGARRNARQLTEQYFSGVTTGLARIEALEAAEKSSQAALDANRLAYEVGVRINIDVLNAQQQLYETQRLLAHARYSTLMHGLRLKAASGILAEDDLLAVNALLSTPASP